jgi:hypothetical protein
MDYLIFPEGSSFELATDTAGTTFVAIENWDGMTGKIGAEAALVEVTTLSDTETKRAKSARKDNGEREMKATYKPDGAGQIALKSACNAGASRKCRLTFPNGAKWEFLAVFAGWTLSEPEAGKAQMLEIKFAINQDLGFTDA